jgi:LuxR family transcriptional regulator, maltose regulon positive regulatory protein
VTRSQQETVVPTLLLETKLYTPKPRRGLVARPRLSERLSRAAESKLTLISAPAGFGKTTLLAEWLDAGPAEPTAARSVSWLSLDESDAQPAAYWTYVITALQAVLPGAGASALVLLRSAQPPIEAVLTLVVNELNALRNDVYLVLDDYHLVDGPDIQAGMTFLLERLPQQVHLVVSTRADPALPLARLRARGELVEIRAADLRFTPEESGVYLNGAMGLALTTQDVAALDGRTEGWIAALQLAALSMQGRDDASAFIAGFAGDDRYIVDYLAEEVLGRQSVEVRDFLLRVSILDRLSGPLCDAVTGAEGGKAALVALDRANLFLVPLDGRREWYRYHHLFADVLRTHLQEDYGDEVPELHRRASVWFEQNGEPSAAIDHALAGKDLSRAADLMELTIPAVRRERREAEFGRWVGLLPDEVVRVRPVLGIFFVGALAQVSDFDTLTGRLSDIERSLGVAPGGTWPEQPPSDVVVVDLTEFQRLPGTVELYRAALALAGGDVAGTLEHARRTRALAPEDDHLTRAGASGLSGLASWTTGDLELAHQSYAECVAGLLRVGHVPDVLGCSIALADIRRAQGRLGDAMRTYEWALQLASGEQGVTALRGTPDIHVGMSEVLRERDDLPAATEHLARSQELGEHNDLPQNAYRWRVAMARLRETEGDLDGALDLLDEAERRYVGDYFPNVRPVPAVRARLRVKRGELGHALAWAGERQLSADDDLSYLREFEHITLVRLLIARHTAQRTAGSLEQAVQLLQRLLTAAEEGERTATVLEVLVLQSLALQAGGDTAAALVPLQRAVTLAEPEGYVRLFAEEGPPMASLLRTVAKQRAAWDYLRRLLDACGKTGGAAPAGPTAPARRTLIDPLSERELDVLRLLGSDLDGPDIARELSISVNTLRTHTKNVYAKLGVNSRRAAVHHAAELNLLSRTRDH